MNMLKAVHALTDLVQPAMPAPDRRHARHGRAWDLPRAQDSQGVTFRFGLTGRRWGTQGPVVLLAPGAHGRLAEFRYVIDALRDAGRQILALDVTPRDTTLARALALAEAAVEIPSLEAVIGHGSGAAAVALALGNGLYAKRVVLLGSPAAGVADAVRALTVPALVVHDSDDTEVPFADGAAVADAWPGAHFLATTGLGHRGLLADAGVVHGIAEFLRGHEAGLPAERLRLAS